MSNDEFNDEEFREFMKDSNYQDILIIIKTIFDKMSFIRELYDNTLKRYIELKEEDPLKDILKQYIIDLIAESKQSFKQFDYAIIDMDSEEDEEEDI